MQNMIFERKLAIPKEVKAMYPLSSDMLAVIQKRNREISEIFKGNDNRTLLIIGPCSADREDSVLEYVCRLRSVQEEVRDKILIIPRLYTNKPRTTGDGYKGLVHQPNPNEKPDMFKGIVSMRELHIKVLTQTGFNCADEMLYPENHRYIDDIVAYIAVGARSVENQQHRLTASGVDIPVGMKNPTSGDLSVMMNAIYAAQNGHTFIYRGWEVHSSGNPLAHAILRGSLKQNGDMESNYHYHDIRSVLELYESSNLENPSLIIDTNHCNSGKNPFEQPNVIRDVLESRNRDSRIKQLIKGFMVESYLEDGNQSVGENVYGKSITDACLGWRKTEQLIFELADCL